MKRDSIIIYSGAVFSILFGFFMSSFPPSRPIIELTIRIGHGIFLFGVSILLVKAASLYIRYNHPKSFSSLISQEFGTFHSAPWIFKKHQEKIVITTNTFFYFIIIIGSILSCILVMYVFLPNIDDIINGSIEISLRTIVLIIISVFSLAAIFILTSVIIIVRRIIKVIDKQGEIIYIYKGFQLKLNPTHLNNNGLHMDISNLKNTEIVLDGIYKFLIPMDGVKGDLIAFKNWIYDKKFVLIQSYEEDFLKEVNSGIMRFLEI